MPTEDISREYSYEQEQADAMRDLLHAMADGKRVKHKRTGAFWKIGAILRHLGCGDVQPTEFQICGPEIIVNGVRVPAPLRVAPADGTTVYVLMIGSTGGATWWTFKWGEEDGQQVELDKGLLYTDINDLRARVAAMLKFQEV